MFTVPKIEIMGESDIHVMEGSSVNLKCVIRQSVRDPDYIFWYQNNKRVLDYGKGAKVISSERLDANTMVATLTINNAVHTDSGNYTCQPSNLDSASAYLHVLNGEWSRRRGGPGSILFSSSRESQFCFRNNTSLLVMIRARISMTKKITKTHYKNTFEFIFNSLHDFKNEKTSVNFGQYSAKFDGKVA